MKFKFIDLFAGVGGFRMALQNLDGHCVFSSEWNQHAKETYFQNYGEYPEGDITLDETKAKIPESFDILCGGFPCQAFSIAGNQKGFNETRGTLFFEIADIAKKHQPKVVFLENVKNLVSHDSGKTFDVIINTLKQLGYAVYFQVLNSMTHANVPQNRERIFIVAFHETLVPNHANFQFPEAIPLTKTIHDFLETEKVDQKYYYKQDHMYYPILSESMTSRDTLYQWRRVYVRENKSNVCPTLTANMGAGGHNVPLIRDAYGIRKLTPKECFAFQGYPVNQMIFPEKMSNSALYMQAGNSVTMPLIQRIGEQILEVIIKNTGCGVMDIQEKQAKWKQERPLFEAAFIHSHLLPFFNFNENTGDYEIKSEYENDEDRALSFNVLNTGWAMWLRAKRDAKAQAPEGFVLVPVKEIKTWYLDDSENIYREDPDWLCDTPIGEVVEVEHRVSYEIDQDPVFATIQWDDVNGDVGYYETFKSKEEAEKVAVHCKAMKEAQEQGHDS